MSNIVFCSVIHYIKFTVYSARFSVCCVFIWFQSVALSPLLQVWLHWGGGPISDQHHNLGSLVWEEDTTRSDLQNQQAPSHLQVWRLLCGKARVQDLLHTGGERLTRATVVVIKTLLLHYLFHLIKSCTAPL